MLNRLVMLTMASMFAGTAVRSPETEAGAGSAAQQFHGDGNRTPNASWPADKSMSYGQWLVGSSFNPSQNPDVDMIKAQTAAIINDLYKLSQDRLHPGARNAAIAITAFEKAAMDGVKAYTKQPWA